MAAASVTDIRHKTYKTDIWQNTLLWWWRWLHGISLLFILSNIWFYFLLLIKLTCINFLLFIKILCFSVHVQMLHLHFQAASSLVVCYWIKCIMSKNCKYLSLTVFCDIKSGSGKGQDLAHFCIILLALIYFIVEYFIHIHLYFTYNIVYVN